MSAVWAPVPDGPDQRAASRGPSRLRAVQPPASRLSRAPFLLVLIGVFGLGMAGLLMLNTTLQNQAFSSRALDRQATELAYAQADLENQIDLVSAPPELARRASALGMRPNPYPAFLEMPSGTVVGKAQPVRGSEVPSLVVRTPAEVAAAKAAAEAKAKAKAEAAAAEKARKAAEAKAQEKAKAAAEKKAAAEQQTAADQKAKKADAKKAEAKKAETKKSQAGRG
jgi:flagellar biosynthesis GTPase FlhF